MRRRSRRGPNESESTGKSGQELPQGQMAPLRPNYLDPPAVRKQEPAATESQPIAPSARPEQHPGRDGGRRREGRAQGALAVVGNRNREPLLPPAPSGNSAAGQDGGGRIVVETQPESLGVPPEEPTAVSQKAPRGFVVLTIGLPGSGKTTWYKRRGVVPLSSDLLRTLLFDDIEEQRYQGLIFSTLRSLLRARLIARMPWNYGDATNLSPHERRQWIKMAKSFGYEVQAVFFDVPLAVCLERNARRDRQVTDEMMHKMAERLRPPSFKEGFDKITVVRVKGHPGTEAIEPLPSDTPAAAAEEPNEPVPADDGEALR